MSELRAPRLHEIARQLRRLHLALVDMERRRYEQEVHAIASRGELLSLLTGHERFRWLGELTRLMVAIDELLDDPQVPDAAGFPGVRAGIERLIEGGAGDAADFRAHYLEGMQREPAVAIAHAALKRLLQDSPRGTDASAELHERHVRTMKREHGGSEHE
jgi:hypothetical protein